MFMFIIAPFCIKNITTRYYVFNLRNMRLTLKGQRHRQHQARLYKSILQIDGPSGLYW
jgi:hypothetical protein